MNNRSSKALILVWLVIALTCSSLAYAQPRGIDCAKASQPIEKLICSHPELSALDDLMASAFKAGLELRSGEERARFLAVQRHWLRARENICSTGDSLQGDKSGAVTCLEWVYRERIPEIAELGEPRSLAILARIQTALNHVAAGIPYDRFTIVGDKLGAVIDVYGAFLAGDGPRFQEAFVALAAEARLRAEERDQNPRWESEESVSEQIERLIKAAHGGNNMTVLEVLVALRLADTILWAETESDFRFQRGAWLRLPCRTIIGRKDAIEQAARALAQVNVQKDEAIAVPGLEPHELVGCPSVGKLAQEFGAIEIFASDPGGKAAEIADIAKPAPSDFKPVETTEPKTLSEAMEAFSRDPSLKTRGGVVMFLHALAPATPEREAAIRQHLAAILMELKVNRDISQLDIDEAVFDVLDVVISENSLSVPCPVIQRDKRYVSLLFPGDRGARRRASHQCEDEETEGFPAKEIKAFHGAGLRTLYDWQMTTGTNGSFLLAELGSKVSALRFPILEKDDDRLTLRPYEMWSHLTLSNRAIYLPINKAYDATLPKLTAYYEKNNIPRDAAMVLAQRNLLDATLGGDCGMRAPPPASLRKLVVERAPLAAIMSFLSSPAARDASASKTYRMCGRKSDGYDQMAHIAVYDPKVFSFLLEFADSLSYEQRWEMDLEVEIDLTNAFGKTPLMTAAQFNFVDTARMLLRRKARVNATTRGGGLREGFRTPLMYAAQSGSLEMIRLLLAAGADRLQADGLGKTALDYLVGAGPTEPNSRLSPEEMAQAARLLF